MCFHARFYARARAWRAATRAIERPPRARPHADAPLTARDRGASHIAMGAASRSVRRTRASSRSPALSSSAIVAATDGSSKPPGIGASST